MVCSDAAGGWWGGGLAGWVQFAACGSVGRGQWGPQAAGRASDTQGSGWGGRQGLRSRCLTGGIYSQGTG